MMRPPTNLRPEVFAGVMAEGVVETIDIYPTIAEICGLIPPASAAGSSLVPMLRNPFSPGKNHAYSRWGALTSIRTSDWRLINTNGDADNDGAMNRFEYGSGSDALDATDKPSVELTTEDLTDLGFTGDEKVYSFTVKSDADDLSLSPATSTDFLAWSFAPLEFLDATQLDDSTHRFRLTDESDPKRFFRLDSGS
jgi:hypothetical protein